MDRLSAVANVLSVLEAACNSTQFIYKFFQSITNGPSEIQDRCDAIQALRSSLMNLQSLCRTSELERQQVAVLLANTEKCLGDVQAAEKQIIQIENNLAINGIHRTWTIVRWALDRNTWLDRFFERLKMWQSIFTRDLVMLHL